MPDLAEASKGDASGVVGAADAPSVTDWLRFQRAFAWTPEAGSEALRAGVSPGRALALFGRGPGRTGTGGASIRGGGDSDPSRLAAVGARILPLTSVEYPARLAALADAPPVLLLRGEVAALRAPAIAIIGARAATRAGLAQARRFGRELAAQGFTIVSGLARGIDGEAHRGALEAGGRTVGVLACGVDQIYPPEHRALAEEICVDGAVASEMPLGTSPRRELFPLRNRIISGLCLAVIVVEARRRSGSLITVRHALGQGREVFVVPGPSDGPFAEGSNRLLRDGARAVATPADVLEDLARFGATRACVRDFAEPLSGAEGVLEAPDSRRACADSAEIDRESEGDDPAAGSSVDPLRGGGEERGSVGLTEAGPVDADREMTDPLAARIVAALSVGPASREDLVARVEIDQGKLARALLDLELAGRIIEERDGQIHLCWLRGAAGLSQPDSG